MTKGWTPEKDMPSLVGKVALVTGGNAGIGFTTVEGLVTHGAKVYMGARSESKANQAIRDLYNKHKSLEKGRVVWLPLDLGDPFGVVKAAEIFNAKEQRLDILVNNAGCAFENFETNEQGFEKTMVVNHLGHFILVNSLMLVLKSTASKKGSDVRVVTVSSSGHSMFVPSKIQFESLENFKNPCAATPKQYTSWTAMMKRYGNSKLANVLFAAELQRHFDKEEIYATSISLNPGGVATEGGLGVWPKLLVPIMRLIMTSPAQGAITSLFAASASVVKESPTAYKGKYLVPQAKLAEPSSAAQDAKLAKDLWMISQKASEEMLSAVG